MLVQSRIPAPVEKVVACFNKASESYQQAARLQRDVGLDLCKLLTSKGDVLIDLGCGPGILHHNLTSFCHSLIALDLSPAMLDQAKSQSVACQYLLADAAAIPLAADSVDSVFSSLMLQWSSQPAQVFSEIARILTPGGQFALSTLVEESLQEFQQCWPRAADCAAPLLEFLPTADVIKLAKQSGLTVFAQQKTYQLFFPDVYSLAREFKQIGANAVSNGAGGLGGKQQWQQFAKAYEQKRTTQGLPLSYQVLFLFGQKPVVTGEENA